MQGVGISIGVGFGNNDRYDWDDRPYGARPGPFRDAFEPCKQCSTVTMKPAFSIMKPMATEPTIMYRRVEEPVTHPTKYWHDMPNTLWKWLDFFTGG